MTQDAFGFHVPAGNAPFQIHSKDRMVLHILDERRKAGLHFTTLFLRLPAIGDVLERKENELRFISLLEKSPCIEEHDLSADSPEYMLHFEAIEMGVLRENLFEQRSQLGNVPLPVA